MNWKYSVKLSWRKFGGVRGRASPLALDGIPQGNGLGTL